jgi:hypothetical protein
MIASIHRDRKGGMWCPGAAAKKKVVHLYDDEMQSAGDHGPPNFKPIATAASIRRNMQVIRSDKVDQTMVTECEGTRAKENREW